MASLGETLTHYTEWFSKSVAGTAHDRHEVLLRAPSLSQQYYMAVRASLGEGNGRSINQSKVTFDEVAYLQSCQLFPLPLVSLFSLTCSVQLRLLIEALQHTYTLLYGDSAIAFRSHDEKRRKARRVARVHVAEQPR